MTPPPDTGTPPAGTPCSKGRAPHVTVTGHPACVGHGKRTGKCCENAPMKGQQVCRMHGGSAPQAKAAAERRLARARLEGEIGDLLAEVEAEVAGMAPAEALAVAQGRAAAMGELLARALLTVDAGDLWGPNHLGDGAPHVAVEMLGEWNDRLARIAKAAADAGIDERRVRLEEAQVVLMERIVRRCWELAEGRLRALLPDRGELIAVWAAELPELTGTAIDEALTEGEEGDR